MSSNTIQTHSCTLLLLFTTDNNACTGPGYYNLEHILATGEDAQITSSKGLHKKPVGSFEPYRRAMSKSKFGLTKSGFNVK